MLFRFLYYFHEIFECNCKVARIIGPSVVDQGCVQNISLSGLTSTGSQYEWKLNGFHASFQSVLILEPQDSNVTLTVSNGVQNHTALHEIRIAPTVLDALIVVICSF